jgi:biotin carboxyl carrier protein
MIKTFVINGEEIKVENYKLEADHVSFELKGKSYKFSLEAKDGAQLSLKDHENFRVYVSSPSKDGESIVMGRGREATISTAGKKPKKAAAAAGSLASPMPGKIFKVLKSVGDEVKKGETILILEAMKMEHSIRSDKDGKIKNLPFSAGQLVQGGVVLAEVE